MIDHRRRVVRWLDGVILLATIVLAITLVRWADRRHLRVQPPPIDPRRHTVTRPGWVWSLEYPYTRLMRDWPWFCVAATLGVGTLLASDGPTWSRRGLSRPGTTLVLVVLLVGVVIAAERILLPPDTGQPEVWSYSLGSDLEQGVPGAVIGAWVVAWLRPRRGSPDWRERLARMVGWIWVANVGLLIGYGLLFG